MTPFCPHEQDVLDLVAIGQWPARADATLVAHAAACETCRDLASVAGAIIESRDTLPTAHVPDASVVWYRAQVRARLDAASRAGRPMLFAQIAAVAGIAAIVLVWSGAGSQWLAAWWQWLAGLVPERSADTTSAWAWTPTALPGLRWLLVAAILLGAIVPLGLWIAQLADRERPERRA